MISIRSITIYCDAASHEPVDVEELVALQNTAGDAGERWTTHVSAPGRQVLKHRQDLDADLAADRTKIVCPHCGDDLTLGDLLGVGFATMLALRHIQEQPPGSPSDRARVETWLRQNPSRHKNLSRVADAGVSRLSMSGLRRTLALP